MEYKRFAGGFVRRESADDEWEEIPQDDVPSWFFSEERAAGERRRLRYDPDGPLAPGRRGSARVLPNPKVDALAEELGLSSAELRGRLNGDTGGTRNRIEEARFDEIMNELGLDPEEGRKRFRS